MKMNHLKQWTVGALSTAMVASSVLFAPAASAAVEPITKAKERGMITVDETMLSIANILND